MSLKHPPGKYKRLQKKIKNLMIVKNSFKKITAIFFIVFGVDENDWKWAENKIGNYFCLPFFLVLSLQQGKGTRAQLEQYK